MTASLAHPPFELFGPAHWGAIALTALAPVALSVAVRRSGSDRVERAVRVGLAWILLGNEGASWVHRFAAEGAAVFAREHLPLHVCGVTVLLAAATLLLRRPLAYQLTYYWGLAGSVNAVLTPDLEVGYPRYEFLQFFVSHGGIVAAALFATWALGMRPTLRGLTQAVVWIHVVAVLVAGVNLALGSNYMYLSAPPASASPFVFLPWPWYLVVLEVVGVSVFVLLYLPTALAKRREAARSRAGAVDRAARRSVAGSPRGSMMERTFPRSGGTGWRGGGPGATAAREGRDRDAPPANRRLGGARWP